MKLSTHMVRRWFPVPVTEVSAAQWEVPLVLLLYFLYQEGDFCSMSIQPFLGSCG